MPCVVAEDDNEGVLSPGQLAGSAFLRRERPNRPVETPFQLTQPFNGRIEIEHWKPLLILTLWASGITRATGK